MQDIKIYHEKELNAAIQKLGIRPNSAVAMIFCNTQYLVEQTALFHLAQKFSHVFLFVTEPTQVMKHDQVTNIAVSDVSFQKAHNIINSALPSLIGKWVCWGYNGEFLLYPFFEDRSVLDLTDFLMSERRRTLFTMLLDAYSTQTREGKEGSPVASTYFDRLNYYAKPFVPQDFNGEPQELERMVSIYGGLRWRFQEHLKGFQMQLNRISLFLVTESLSFDHNGITDEPEFYTVNCEHHHSTTGCVLSYQIMRALLHNPYSRDNIRNFRWEGSEKLQWNSPQLLRFGFMETGQWF